MWQKCKSWCDCTTEEQGRYETNIWWHCRFNFYHQRETGNTVWFRRVCPSTPKVSIWCLQVVCVICYYIILNLKGYFPCRSTPIETLHTILLGPYKYLLRRLMSKLSNKKNEIRSRIASFSFSYCRMLRTKKNQFGLLFPRFVQLYWDNFCPVIFLNNCRFSN